MSDQSALGDRNRLPAAAIGAAVAALALVPRLATVRGQAITHDEPLWMQRSQRFSDAVLEGRFAEASVTTSTDEVWTMPGVTTMWLGSLARLLWATGRGLGLLDHDHDAFQWSADGLNIAQGLVAIVTAGLIGLIVVLVASWVCRTAGVATGLLLATEPFFVSHSALLHTDALYTLTGVAGLIAMALFLGVPSATVWRGRTLMAVASCLLLGAALLTKASAVMLLPGAGLLALWGLYNAGVRLMRPASWGTVPRALANRRTLWILIAVAAVVLVYPALWANPADELVKLYNSSTQAGRGHSQFFLGERTMTPGAAFYLVALPLRMTPWFLAASVAAFLAGCWIRVLRPWVGIVACLLLPPLAILSMASKQFDRYGLPVMAVLALLIGVVAQHAAPRLAAVIAKATQRVSERWSGAHAVQHIPRLIVAVVILSLSVHALRVAPWGLAYYNPGLGGSGTARKNVLIGWGEGLELAVGFIEDEAGHGCGQIPITSSQYIAHTRLEFWRCYTGPARPDDSYLVTYIEATQLNAPQPPPSTLLRPRIGEVTIRGIHYGDIYGPRSPHS